MSNLPRRNASGEAIFRTITAADWKRSHEWAKTQRNPVVDQICRHVQAATIGRRVLPMYSGSELSPAKDPEKDEHENPAA